MNSELPNAWFAKYGYDRGGVVIQAGSKPDVINTEVDPLPATYALLNAALKQVRMTEIGTLHYPSQDGEPRLHGWAADQWLARLDIAGDDLFKYKQKLLTEPPVAHESLLQGKGWDDGTK